MLSDMVQYIVRNILFLEPVYSIANQLNVNSGLKKRSNAMFQSYTIYNRLKEGAIMSFADELKKPIEKKEDPNYKYADSRIAECIEAIKDACLKARMAGRNYIDGMFHASDSDYGTYTIEKIGTYFSTAHGFPADYWRDGVERGIRNLGFTDYTVKLISQPEKTYLRTGVFGQVLKKTGNTVVGLHIRISW